MYQRRPRTVQVLSSLPIHQHLFLLILLMTMLSLRAARAFSTNLSHSIATSSSQRSGSAGWSLLLRNMSTAPVDDDSMSFQTDGQIGNSVHDAMSALYHADAVCFDVDSTVIAEEGIDVLAEYLGKGEAVAALTKQAMEGGMRFQDALQARMDLLQPSKGSILQCLEDQPLVLTKGVQGLMEALQKNQIDIWLVSGGFRIMIEPIAQTLKIPITNIYANTLLFDEEGNYQTFDATEPTSADMGKPKALTLIKDLKGYNTMVMVGDGATDAQAKPPANAFIGFGGVVERDAVKAQADWFVTDFDDMTKIVNLRGSD